MSLVWYDLSNMPSVGACLVFVQFGAQPGFMTGLAQFATGCINIGQFAFGKYVVAQMGIGKFVWSMTRAAPQAIEFFKSLPVVSYFLILPD
jgi:hypothetical protein